LRTVRPLAQSDAEELVRLRREALADAPLAFSASPATDVASTVDGARMQIGEGDGAAVFGAFEGGRLVGMAGVYRPRHEKARHKVHVWGVYVTPDARGRGIAGELMDSVIKHARAIPEVAWVALAVSSSAPAARRVYERAGFQVWGMEIDAVRHGDESADENHMALRLR
jgi:RimJ/RimL family protein N-acetyltransferase